MFFALVFMLGGISACLAWTVALFFCGIGEVVAFGQHVQNLMASSAPPLIVRNWEPSGLMRMLSILAVWALFRQQFFSTIDPKDLF